MQNNIDRAWQFKSFDALKGFREALELVEKTRNFNLFSNLETELLSLKKGELITVGYYIDLEYIETKGLINKIDRVNEILYISNSKISFKEIISIKKETT